MFSEKVDELKFGNPWDNNALTNSIARSQINQNILKNLISDAKAKGAKIINRNGGLTSENYVFPAVLFPVHRKIWKCIVKSSLVQLFQYLTFNDINEPLE